LRAWETAATGRKGNGIQTYEFDELDLLARYFSSDPYFSDKLQ
jgi:hypothetical protein